VSIRAEFQITRQDFTLDVNLAIPGNGITGLFGPSGCGKTTLLRAIAGLDHHPGGVLNFGNDHWQTADHFTPVHERGLGYVFQEPSLFDHLSVERNLLYALNRVPGSERRISLEQCIELLEISPLLTRHPDSLSGGEKQRVAIARALAGNPRLLLMDEPLASLDLGRRREILPLIKSLQAELQIPLVYVSHAVDEVARLADHMVVLAAGSVAAEGAVGSVLSSLELSVAHGDSAEVVLEARVSGHHDEWGLTDLEVPAGLIRVAQVDREPGSLQRLVVAARDVSVVLSPHEGSSILNVLPATVEQIVEDGPSQVMVRLDAGGQYLLARLTRKSAHDLGLEKGSRVYAQVKSVALLS
jgi:molybdate transport system ATP-binding protein